MGYFDTGHVQFSCPSGGGSVGGGSVKPHDLLCLYFIFQLSLLCFFWDEGGASFLFWGHLVVVFGMVIEPCKENFKKGKTLIGKNSNPSEQKVTNR